MAALARTGQVEEAEQVASSITNPDRQAQALADVTAALVEAGQLERATETTAEAEQVASSITNPAQQAQALADVAAALVKVRGSDRDTARAVHLTAVVLTGTAWLEGLPALITLAPDAVKGIRNALQQERS